MSEPVWPRPVFRKPWPPPRRSRYPQWLGVATSAAQIATRGGRLREVGCALQPANLIQAQRAPRGACSAFAGHGSGRLRRHPKSEPALYTPVNDVVAGGLGFEPRLTESESAVLPLNYPPTRARMRRGWRKAASPLGASPADDARASPAEVFPAARSATYLGHPARHSKHQLSRSCGKFFRARPNLIDPIR